MATISLHQYTMAARSLMAHAQARADKATHVEVSPFHLLAELLSSRAAVFRDAGADPVNLGLQIELRFIAAPRSSEPATLDLATMDLLAAAERHALDAGGPVSTEHIARALFALPEMEAFLVGVSVTPESFRDAAPTAASSPTPVSEAVHLYEGRKLLRGLAARVRTALGLDSADDMPERASRLLDAVAAVLRGADGLPDLGAVRESPLRLRLTRAGASGEISIAWDSTVRMVVMHAKKETSSPTRLSRYTWNGTVGQWSTASSKEQFFEALSEALVANLYPEGAPDAEPPDQG